MKVESKIKPGDNVVYQNVYGSWSCKVLAVQSENIYKLLTAQGQVLIGIHSPNSTQKHKIIPFGDDLFMVT